MHARCRAAVEAALGRPLTTREAQGLVDRVSRQMRQMAARDPAAWRALPPDQQFNQAAQAAARDLVAEAQKKAQRAVLAIQRKQEVEGYLADQIASGADRDGVQALIRLMVGKNDFRNNTTPVETEVKAMVNDSLRQISDAVEKLRPGLWSVLPWSDPQMERWLVDALHGVADPNRPAEVDAAAKAFQDLAEARRQEFNAEGGNVGRLENWGMPHAWADWLVLKAGQQKFVDDFMTYIDRSKYVHEDGTRFSDQEMRDYLAEAYLTIATNGLSKKDAGPQFPGGAVKANRHRQHRALHLRADKAFDAYKAYMGRNAYEAMVGHLRQMARDIVLVRRLGPNADHVFQTVLDDAVREAARADPARAQAVEGAARYAQGYYDYVAGNTPPPANRAFADTMSFIRSWQVLTKLGGASVAAFVQDPVFLHLVAHQNGLNQVQVVANQALAFSPKGRRFVKRLGLLAETIAGNADRFAHHNVNGREFGSRMAGEFLRLTGMNFITETRRIGFAVTMMDAIGHLTRRYQDVTKLRADDYRVLAGKGIDQATWDIWRAARLEKYGANGRLLTPDAILAVPGFTDAQKQAAVIKLLSVVQEELDLAVLTPGARERVQLGAGLQAGTPGGELVRSVVLFKSFPWAVLTRHWERALGGYQGARRFGAVAALVVFSTMSGIILNWINDLRNGRDPRTINPMDPNGVRNLIQGFMTGGGFGIYGDFLFAEYRAGGATVAETIAGPVVSDAGVFLTNTIGVAQQSAQGEDVAFEPSTVNAVRGLVPGQNLWYTKAATDRLLFSQFQDMLDPGYTERLMRRQERQRGTEYFWALNEPAPARAPDLANAVEAN